MKKSMGSGSVKKSAGPSKSSSFSSKPSSTKSRPGSSGKSIFSRKSESSSSQVKHEKPFRADEPQKNRFVKPPHDPGDKIRPEQSGASGNYQAANSGNYASDDNGGVQENVQRTGRGCCSSITGIITLSIIAVVVIIVVLISKCG